MIQSWKRWKTMKLIEFLWFIMMGLRYTCIQKSGKPCSLATLSHTSHFYWVSWRASTCEFLVKKGWELNLFDIFDLLTYIMGVCDLAGRNYNSTLTIILLSDLSIQKLYFSNNAWTQRVINARRSTSHHRRRWAERFGIKTLRLIKGYRYLVWWSTGIGTHLVSIHGGRVAKALAFYATLEVTGSCPTFGGISEIYFSNRYSLRHGGT